MSTTYCASGGAVPSTTFVTWTGNSTTGVGPAEAIVAVAATAAPARRLASRTLTVRTRGTLGVRPRRGAGHLLPGRQVSLVGRAPDVRDRVDVGRPGPQRGGGALLLRPDGEGVELVVAHRVLVRELVDRRLVEVGEQLLAPLRGVRPRAVGVRVVRLPAHVVDVELVEQLHADPVVDEAAEDPLAEQVGRVRALRELVTHPPVVPLERVLGAPQEVRDPPDVAFGEREPQVGEAVPEVSPEEVTERVDRHRRRQAHGNGHGCVGRGRRALRRRTDVAAQDRTDVAGRGEQWVPRVGVDARHAQTYRVLRERDRVAALVGESADLLRALVRVVQRQDAAGDEALRVRAAPLVDVPVVVRLDHDEVDGAVGAELEHLAREAGPVREVEPGELPAGGHVAHALVDVVAAGPHVLVPHGLDVEHLGRLARDGVETEVPPGDFAVVPLLRAVGAVDDARRLVAIALGHMALEHVGGFGDVVGERDEDHVVAAHDPILPHHAPNRSAWISMRLLFLQSKVPGFVGCTLVNSPSCTCVSTKQLVGTWLPMSVFPHIPSPVKSWMSWSSSSSAARVRPFTPSRSTTLFTASRNSSPASHAYAPKPVASSSPTPFR